MGLQIRDKIVPGSDGAGVVTAIGAKVSHFSVGDKVCTHMVRGQSDSEPATLTGGVQNGLGQQLDGTFRQRGMFDESNIVHAPVNVSFREASTLTCSALTAWNALFGLEGKQPKPGDCILTQGTGGVSIAALQFAVACGANVIATTGSDEKADRLKKLGAAHVINYKSDASWGQTAKSLTPNGRGVDHVVDIGGQSTLEQSLLAVRTDGLITLAGVIGHSENAKPVELLSILWGHCTARGVVLGSRTQFREMNGFIEDRGIRPVVDDHVFRWREVKEAYTFVQEQRHFGKAVVDIISG